MAELVLLLLSILSLTVLLAVLDAVIGPPYVGAKAILKFFVFLVVFSRVLSLFETPQTSLPQLRSLSCWDTDATGICTLLKDANLDGLCNADDCLAQGNLR